MSQNQVSDYLETIKKIFKFNILIEESVDENTTVKYYEQSEYGYRIYHSDQGYIHMAINYDGVFNSDGYYEQARIVNKQIQEIQATNVLELGCGKGVNSIFLAGENPDVNFLGIDLTPLHISYALKKSQDLKNVRFAIGNFQALDFIEDQTFNIIFEVESICHATEMKMLLNEAYRILKPGGRFIVIDGFREKQFSQHSSELQTAATLVEKCMGVAKNFMEIDEWLEISQASNFKVLRVENLSFAVMPTMLRLQSLAQRYFKKTLRAKLLNLFMPPYLMRNSVAGLLMPETIAAKVHGYYLIVLEK